MARHRRKSTILESARQRLAGLKEFTPKPDFGPGLSVESFEAEVNGFRDVHDSYNGDLAALDDKTNELEEREQRLADFNQRILAAVKGLYGPDSSEYEQETARADSEASYNLIESLTHSLIGSLFDHKEPMTI